MLLCYTPVLISICLLSGLSKTAANAQLDDITKRLKNPAHEAINVEIAIKKGNNIIDSEEATKIIQKYKIKIMQEAMKTLNKSVMENES